jgi:hypothetical protein
MSLYSFHLDHGLRPQVLHKCNTWLSAVVEAAVRVQQVVEARVDSVLPQVCLLLLALLTQSLLVLVVLAVFLMEVLVLLELVVETLFLVL